MMSADGPAAMNPAGVTVFSAGDEFSAAAASVPLPVQETTIPVATNGDLQRFQSTAEFEAWLLEAATAQYGHLFGQSTYHYGWNWHTIDYTDALDGDVFAPVLRASANVNFNGAHSATNVQVAGVDEADLVETDGEHLYIISGKDLVIVKAGVSEELQVVSRVQLDERPVGMYLSGDRLALVSSSAMAGFGSPFRLGRPLIWSGMPLFTDDLAFSPQEIKPPATTVTLLDITDRAAPTLVHKTEMDGQLVTSRTVDGQLRLVLTNDMHLPMPIARPVEGTSGAEQTAPIAESKQIRLAVDMAWYPVVEANYVYEARDEYLARVREEIFAAGPQFRSMALDGSVISESPFLSATEIYRPASHLDQHAVTVATFDLTSDVMGPAATATIMTNGLQQVYVDEDSIYVFAEQAPNQQWSEVGLWSAGEMPKTGVWKFEIDNQSHDIELVATGEFDGALLNQFAADEHNGRLRVVTEARWNSVGQSLHVLEQVGDELKVVGSLDGIATNEQLYSVRFLENTVFFVTFRQTDPLFVVDLSDPVNPQLRGELHIPGFSDYLQPIDENHLLAIGRDADEVTGQFQELQVSIFDVSDLTDPQLLHRYSFDGGRSTMTPATGDRWSRGDGDHHAVSYFSADQIFALPIYTAADIAWFSDVDQQGAMFEAGKGGLQVFRIDLDEGFTPLGIIEHDTLVERSMQVGDHLYAISNGTLTVHELTDPSIRLGELEIAATGAEHIALTFYEAALETVSQTSSDLLRERPVSRAVWMPVAHERIRFKPAMRAVDFAEIPSSDLLDDELVNAIAIDAASAAESSAASMVDLLPVDNTTDDGEDSDRPGRQLLARRGAFRPVAARLGA